MTGPGNFTANASDKGTDFTAVAAIGALTLAVDKDKSWNDGTRKLTLSADKAIKGQSVNWVTTAGSNIPDQSSTDESGKVQVDWKLKDTDVASMARTVKACLASDASICSNEVSTDWVKPGKFTGYKIKQGREYSDLAFTRPALHGGVFTLKTELDSGQTASFSATGGGDELKEKTLTLKKFK